MTVRICLIEDDEIMGESLVDRFRLEGMQVEWFRDARTAMHRMQQHAFNLAVSDIRLPDMSGESMFRALAAASVNLPPFIFITAFGTIERAVELLKLGAVDYLCKPFEIDELLAKISRYQRPFSVSVTPDEVFRGESAGMIKLRSLLPRYAKSADTVLITGESGVGKEFFARLLHNADPQRAAQPFFAINCAAIPEALVESELFGHEKGSFSGAFRQQHGAFEHAGMGTLFLDEIGDLSLAAQVKLLRVLQERAARRVGGEALIRFHCRVVAATNRPIAERARTGAFREDLLYRINPLHLHVPALRERRDEVIDLARDFLNQCNQRTDAPAKSFTVEVEAAIASYDWPGNVRELKSAVERACLLAGGRLIERGHLFDDLADDSLAHPEQPAVLASFLVQQERAFLFEQLRRHQWRITETAQAIGISRKGLWEKMRRFNISEPSSDIAK
jgi:DNA-binding NtrC family response regulator